MIEVVFDRPPAIRNVGDYSSKAHSSGKFSTKSSGSAVQQYEFARKFGELKAVIEALQEVPCTASIRVIGDGVGRVNVTGTIRYWERGFGTKEHQVAAEIEALAWAIDDACPRSSFDFHHTLTREIVPRAA